MSDTVDATGYIVVEAKRANYGYVGRPREVREAKLVKVLRSKPAELVGDQVAVKVTIRLPKSAFEALSPEAVIEVPEDLVQKPVEVTARE